MTMKTIRLGRSDLQVTPICLGTMTFGEQVDEATAHAILDRSLERGINFIDSFLTQSTLLCSKGCKYCITVNPG